MPDGILESVRQMLPFAESKTDDHTRKVMTPDGEEVGRRYPQYILQKGLIRIRHFGYLADRSADR